MLFFLKFLVDTSGDANGEHNPSDDLDGEIGLEHNSEEN